MKTEIGTCKDCRWWRSEQSQTMKPCKKEITADRYAVDGGWGDNEYKRGIVTGPDFGCIHWEERGKYES